MDDRDKTRDQLIDEVTAHRARIAELESLASAEAGDDSTAAVRESVRRLAQETETVAEVGRIISSSLDMDEVYERFANEVRKVISFERISIDSIDVDSGTYKILYVSGRDVKDRRPGAVVPLEGSFTEEVVRTRSSLLLMLKEGDSPKGRPQGISHGLQVGFLSYIAVPMITKGEVVGIMHLRSSRVNAFTERDQKLAESVGAEIASAFANARLYELLRLRSEELSRSNAELEQFAYVASHDLQEPLRMVSSYVQLLARRYQGKLDADADEFIAYAVDGANRMRVLIDDLLAYSQVATRELELDTTDCNEVFDQTLTNLKVAIEDSDARVTRDDLPTLTADRGQMTRLFQNLLSNAIKFRSKDPPRVHVSTEPRSTGWAFSFRDNGIGIAPEHRERVFLVFQRLHGRAAYPGTGIGLAVCKRIVERHRGDIWIESEPGAGATFHFSLSNSPEGGDLI